MTSPGAGCDVWFSNPTGSFWSPNGIQQPSPLQRQWISLECMGRSSRMASIVNGASASQRAVKFRSPTRMERSATPARLSRAVWCGEPTGGRMADRPTISTHVLDTEHGRPRTGLAVELYRLDTNTETLVGGGTTDDDGRIRDLLVEPLLPAVYRLAFDVGGTFFRAASV